MQVCKKSRIHTEEKMDKRPLVSIIIPTYNCARYIASTIDSVLSQTMDDWEIQIVDDCSTDNTLDVLRPYLEQYPQIHYIRLNENGGPAVARTEAIRRSEGKYIAFLDSDDIWLPEKLERQISFMKENHVEFSCTAYSQMDEEGKPIPLICYPPEKADYSKMLRLNNPIGNLTVVYDQETLGKYEVPPIKKRNDFALWLKILHDTKYCYGMQEKLACYRVRTNSVSSNKAALAKYHWELYRKIEKLDIFRSLFYLCCWAVVKGTGLGLKREHVQNNQLISD